MASGSNTNRGYFVLILAIKAVDGCRFRTREYDFDNLGFAGTFAVYSPDNDKPMVRGG